MSIALVRVKLVDNNTIEAELILIVFVIDNLGEMLKLSMITKFLIIIQELLDLILGFSKNYWSNYFEHVLCKHFNF